MKKPFPWYRCFKLIISLHPVAQITCSREQSCSQGYVLCIHNSTKAKWNSHAVRQCTSHTAFGVSMERVFGVTVADSLSRYYEYDTIEDEYPNSEFIKADEILDPDGDLAPIQRFVEI